MVSEGICSDGKLALSDCLLRFFEVSLEVSPSFFGVGAGVPFSDIAGENIRFGNDTESQIKHLLWSFCRMGMVSHEVVFADLHEHLENRLGVVVDGCFHFHFGTGEGLGSYVSVRVK
jgi:hypothetical protein